MLVMNSLIWNKSLDLRECHPQKNLPLKSYFGGNPEPKPPSTATDAPVTKEASSLARNTATLPTSSGRPILHSAWSLPASALALTGSGWLWKLSFCQTCVNVTGADTIYTYPFMSVINSHRFGQSYYCSFRGAVSCTHGLHEIAIN